MATTHVTGTLVDSQSTVWTNALIKITFVLPANNPNPAIWSDGAFNHGPITLMTDDSGHFAIDLPSTTSIIPANSTWLFNIGPNASAQAVNLNIGVTGASMDISSLFTANAGVLLVQSLEIPRAYGAFELETPVNMGQLWFNVTTGEFQFWNGTIWDVFGDATGDVGIGFPPPGIAVSAGDAWGNSIDPRLVPLLDGPDGNLIIGGAIKAYGFSVIDLTASHTTIGVGGEDNGNTPVITLVNAEAPIDQRVWIMAARTDRTIFTAETDTGSDTIWLQALRTGHIITEVDIITPLLTLSGNIVGAGSITAQGAIASRTTLSVGDPFNTFLNVTPSGDSIVLDCFGTDNVTNGQFIFRSLRHDGSNPVVALTVAEGNASFNGNVTTTGDMDVTGAITVNGTLTTALGQLRIGAGQTGGWGSGTPNINSDGNGLKINSTGAGAVFLGWDMGGTTLFGNGASVEVGRVSPNGDAHFNGTLSASAILIGSGGFLINDDGGSSFIDGGHGGRLLINSHVTGGVVQVTGDFSVSGAKSFVVPHPLIADKDLSHSCLEGPENGVFYRGEVITKSGHAVVTLPDYFESLTYKEDRSVLLTVIAIEDNPVFGGQIAASRVIDGRFVVFSSDDSVTVAWEVKAVRRIGVERLSVISDKFESKGIVNA